MHSAGFISTSIDEGFNIAAAEAKLLQKELFLRDIEIHRLNHDGTAHFFDSVNDLCALFNNYKNKDFNYLNKKSLATNSSKSLNNFPSADILNMYYNFKKFNF